MILAVAVLYSHYVTCRAGLVHENIMGFSCKLAQEIVLIAGTSLNIKGVKDLLACQAIEEYFMDIVNCISCLSHDKPQFGSCGELIIFSIKIYCLNKSGYSNKATNADNLCNLKQQIKPNNDE